MVEGQVPFGASTIESQSDVNAMQICREGAREIAGRYRATECTGWRDKAKREPGSMPVRRDCGARIPATGPLTNLTTVRVADEIFTCGETRVPDSMHLVHRHARCDDTLASVTYAEDVVELPPPSTDPIRVLVSLIARLRNSFLAVTSPRSAIHPGAHCDRFRFVRYTAFLRSRIENPETD